MKMKGVYQMRELLALLLIKVACWLLHLDNMTTLQDLKKVEN